MPDVSPVAKKVTITKKSPRAKFLALGIILHKNIFYLYYHGKLDDGEKISVATSKDGFTFTKQKKAAFISTGAYTSVNVKNCSEFSFSEQDGYLNLMYTWTVGKKKSREKAYSKDLFTWTYEDKLPFDTSGAIVPKFFL